MGTYHQLTEHQRYQMYALKKAGHDQQSIAATLEVSPSTICRELRRNRYARIQPTIANQNTVKSDLLSERVSGRVKRQTSLRRITPERRVVSGRMVEAAGIEPASEIGSTEIYYVRSRP